MFVGVVLQEFADLFKQAKENLLLSSSLMKLMQLVEQEEKIICLVETMRENTLNQLLTEWMVLEPIQM
jgi:ATP-dependent Zn protease